MTTPMPETSVDKAPSELLVASHIYSHHSPTSGYGQLCQYLPGRKLLSTDVPSNTATEGTLSWRINRRLFDLRVLRESRHAHLLHVLYAENHPSLLFSAIRRLNPAIKLVGTFHLPLGYRSMKKSLAMLKYFDGIIALTAAHAEEIRQALPGKKVWFIPHGRTFDHPYIDLEAPVRSPAFDIITVGSNYRDWMCYGQILKLARPHFPHWRFHLVGGGERGVYWFGKDPDVITHPRMTEEEYFRLLNSARALLLPLKFASANNALLEAHSVGLPAVCTDLPGIHDYSVSTTRFFKDAKGAVIQLEQLAALDEAATKSLRTEIRKETRRFDWRNISREISGIYREFVQKEPYADQVHC